MCCCLLLTVVIVMYTVLVMQDFGELDKLESMTTLVELSLVSNAVSSGQCVINVSLMSPTLSLDLVICY